MSSEMKRWNMFFPQDLLEEVKKLAVKKGVTAADVMRVACEKYMTAVKKAEAAALESENVAG